MLTTIHITQKQVFIEKYPCIFLGSYNQIVTDPYNQISICLFLCLEWGETDERRGKAREGRVADIY